MCVSQVNSHSKYLGLPLTIRNNKTEMFKYLVEGTLQKVLGWNKKVLSAAGREVLIKFNSTSVTTICNDVLEIAYHHVQTFIKYYD